MTQNDPVHDLEQLIEAFKQSGLRELHGRCGDMEVHLSLDADAGVPKVTVGQVATPVAPVAPPPVAAGVPSAVSASAVSASAGDIPAGAVVVKAPYLGTFYRAPKPGAAPYVELGQVVGAEDEICLVEVMKLFTAVRAGASGKIHAVLATDGELVAADQPLFVILPE